MNYYDRYLNGEYEQVWEELQSLGSAIRQENHFPLACKIAAETMQRVRRNLHIIVSRLQTMDYVFGTYPDGSTGYFTQGPLVPPSEKSLADLAELEEQIGPLPLSLAAFWREVGIIDMVGMHPAWPDNLDPLVINEPEGAISDLENRLWLVEEEIDQSARFEAGLAPDEFHKDNVSGGPAYSVALPDQSVDFVLLNERHNVLFVPYLRMAILKWGGFPGLDRQKGTFEGFNHLISDLEPF